jgi:ATP-dependent Lon protease
VVEIERTVPLLATRDLILFPRMLTSVFVARDKSVRALEQAHLTGLPLVVSVQKVPTVEEPTEDDIRRVGTLAKVVQLSRLSDGTVKALVEGQTRVEIESFTAVSPHFSVRYRPLEDRRPRDRVRLRALMDSVAREFGLYVEQSPQLPEEAETALEPITDPVQMIDAVAPYLDIAPDRRQDLLEGRDVQKRLMLLLEILIQENEFLAIEQDIADRVQENLERHQRKVFLRERLRVLRDELGDEADEESEEGQYLRPSWPWSRRTWITRSASRGASCPGRPFPTWRLWRGCWTRPTTVWRMSRTASSSISRSRGCGGGFLPTPPCAWWGRPVWARHRWPWP